MTESSKGKFATDIHDAALSLYHSLEHEPNLRSIRVESGLDNGGGVTVVEYKKEPLKIYDAWRGFKVKQVKHRING